MKHITDMHKDMLINYNSGSVISDLKYWTERMANFKEYSKTRSGGFGRDWRNLEDVIILATEVLNEKK